MGGTNKVNNVITDNKYLEDAFKSCKNLNSSSAQYVNIFSGEKMYDAGQGSKVTIAGGSIYDCYKLFYGFDFNDMVDDNSLTTFNYDKNNDGRCEMSYSTQGNKAYVEVDEDSNGIAEQRYEYIDGILRGLTKYSADGKEVLTYTTYDENGNLEGLGKQIENGAAVILTNCFTDWLYSLLTKK